jgi:hypothetical protein
VGLSSCRNQSGPVSIYDVLIVSLRRRPYKGTDGVDRMGRRAAFALLGLALSLNIAKGTIKAIH